MNKNWDQTKQQALVERYPDVEATFERYEQGKDESDVCVCVHALVCMHMHEYLIYKKMTSTHIINSKQWWKD